MRSVYCCATYVAANIMKHTVVFLKMSIMFVAIYQIWSLSTDFVQVPNIKLYWNPFIGIHDDKC